MILSLPSIQLFDNKVIFHVLLIDRILLLLNKKKCEDDELTLNWEDVNPNRSGPKQTWIEVYHLSQVKNDWNENRNNLNTRSVLYKKGTVPVFVFLTSTVWGWTQCGHQYDWLRLVHLFGFQFPIPSYEVEITFLEVTVIVSIDPIPLPVPNERPLLWFSYLWSSLLLKPGY